MCGRFTLSKPVRQVADLFKLAAPPPALQPRFNIAPTQKVAVVAVKGDGNALGFVPWGLVPEWANDDRRKHFNARDDGLHKPTFHDAFRRRRCLIVADGFYKWQAVGRRKQPYHFSITDGRPFAFAALWDCWTGDDRKHVGCCLVTTRPNDVVAPFHDRMPAILGPDAFDLWLDPDAGEADLRGLLKPYPAGEMTGRAVSAVVNKSGHDGPDCLAPAA